MAERRGGEWRQGERGGDGGGQEWRWQAWSFESVLAAKTFHDIPLTMSTKFPPILDRNFSSKQEATIHSALRDEKLQQEKYQREDAAKQSLIRFLEGQVARMGETVEDSSVVITCTTEKESG
eukprot:755206-Hanusia_phi.AAC.9